MLLIVVDLLSNHVLHLVLAVDQYTSYKGFDITNLELINKEGATAHTAMHLLLVIEIITYNVQKNMWWYFLCL